MIMMLKRRAVAFILALMMLASLTPFLVVSVSAGSIDAVSEAAFLLGEEIYRPTLTGESKTLPDGWVAASAAYNPWPNNGGSGGWVKYDESNKNNSEINTSKVTRTSSGVKVTLGTGDFSIVFPKLKNSAGEAVENYAYTVKVSYPTASGKGSFGLITDAAGSTDFKGGTFFMIYAGSRDESHRFYNAGAKGTRKDFFSPVKRDASEAVDFPNDGSLTVTVYHCDNVSYCFVDGKFVCAGKGNDYYGGAAHDGIGLHFSSTQGLVIKEISVKEASFNTGVSAAMSFSSPSVRFCNTDGRISGEGSDGLRLSAKIDKTSAFYKNAIPEGTYKADNEKIKFGMLILPEDKIPKGETLKVDTPDVLDVPMTKIYSQDEKELSFKVSLLGIPQKDYSRAFVCRIYMKEKSGDSWDYVYSEESGVSKYSTVANVFYGENKNEEVRRRLDAIFEGCEDYQGNGVRSITFSLFADLHYIDGKYMSSIADLESILKRAKDANADFVIQAGDFCNDFIGSPELTNAYLKNSYGLPVYGIYGNHDLESTDRTNSMAYVTPLLTNDKNVIWGTENGKMARDGSIGYYYYEVNGFRIICLDTNYYYNKKEKVWKHYPSWYAGPPKSEEGQYEKINSLGPVQLEWLEGVLDDAAEKELNCIVLTHASVAGTRGSSQSSDHAAVRALYKKANEKRAGTVFMSINGHHHTNHTEMIDGVLYFDLNTVRNGAWYSDGKEHYTNETFDHVTYDKNGLAVSSEKVELASLKHGRQTWFFKDPLSAIVRVYSSGRIVIEGAETEWIAGIAPGRGADGEEPLVNSGTFDLPLN